MDTSFVFKVCVIGDQGVGKTATVTRWSTGGFEEEYQVTVGVQHFTREVRLDIEGVDICVKLILWDIGGQAAFKAIRSLFYRSAKALVVMYDVSNRMSFESVIAWVNEAENIIGQKVPVVLVGNKADMTPYAVDENEGHRLAESIGAVFMLSSAKTGTNVSDIFQTVAELLYQKFCKLAVVGMCGCSVQELSTGVQSTTESGSSLR